MWEKFIFLSFFMHCAIGEISIGITNSPEAFYPISAVWDAKGKSAYYVDYGVPFCNAEYPCLFHYDSIKRKTYTASIGGKSLPSPTFLIPAESPTDKLTRFVASFGKTAYLIEWDGYCSSAEIVKIMFTLDEENPSTRLGIGHRDESGNILYASNINVRLCAEPAKASIYLHEKECGLIYTDIPNLELPGGFGYDKTRGFVYILDPCSLIITRYNTGPYGSLSKPKIILDFKNYGYQPGKFVPLGLEADSKGNLYTASSLDGFLWYIDTMKCDATQVLKLPFNGLTSITYGGDNGQGDDLYVTVASEIIDLVTGKIRQKNNPRTSLYRISGLGKGTTFERLDVCDA